MTAPAEFPPVPAPVTSVRGVEPLLVGVIGPPGSGKTRSILRMMRGVQRVRQGPVVLIDTEAGRSKKFSPKPGQEADPSRGTYDFQRIDLEPPFRSDRCLEAIRQALKVNPAAIGFDNLSDEHDGEGGYLEWHDDIINIPRGQPGYVGGNEWGAWAKPAAARKRFSSGIGHITVPLFFTFRAAEKTAEKTIDGKKKIVNIGWVPVAPLLLIKTMDLTCILPYDSKGTPVWKSRDLPGEDFIRKWPDELREIMKEGQLTEAHGEALARWAMGDDAPAGPVQVGADLKVPGPAFAGAGVDALRALMRKHLPGESTGSERTREALQGAFGEPSWVKVTLMAKNDPAGFQVGLANLRKTCEGLATMKAEAEQPEREPGTGEGDETE